MTDVGPDLTPVQQRLTEDFYPEEVPEDFEPEFLTDEELSQALADTAAALEDLTMRLERVESELGL